MNIGDTFQATSNSGRQILCYYRGPVLMEGLLNFCETFLILEEVMKHRLGKKCQACGEFITFLFYGCLLCTKRVLVACKAQADKRTPKATSGDFHSFGKATAYIE